MEPFSEIRLWEVRFLISRPMESFPVPYEIVLERQTTSRYHLEGRNRRCSGFTQIVCTLEGEGAFRYKDKVYALTPGKGFLCTLNDPDSAYFYPGHAKDPWIFLWMDFSGERTVEMLEEMADRYGHVFDFPPDSGLIRYLKSFRNRRRSTRAVTPTEGAKIVCTVLSLLGEHLERKDAESPGSRLVQAAQSIISGDPGRTLTLQEIAVRLQVSREHLSRIFHQRTGLTLEKFAEEERMQYAVRLLRDSFMSVGEIAEQMGYSSSVSFSRAFLRRFGYTPVKYRKKRDLQSAKPE